MAWEYKTLIKNVTNGHITPEELDALLNEAAVDDWELFSVTTLMHDGHTTCMVHHFRRPAEHKQRAGFTA